MLKTRKVLQSYDPAGLVQVWTVFLTTTKKLTNEFISANLFGILFFFVYRNVELDDGFSTLFFS